MSDLARERAIELEEEVFRLRRQLDKAKDVIRAVFDPSPEVSLTAAVGDFLEVMNEK